SQIIAGHLIKDFITILFKLESATLKRQITKKFQIWKLIPHIHQQQCRHQPHTF
ncbi:hypothetical protein SAMD00019534_017710, partial [Acytostelium subglobosum LB1]|uniref:hypothetical protein n=1 Tax=Acytostelium subglobosum LB1 TaxID=1410327 RepID=UPI00064499D9